MLLHCSSAEQVTISRLVGLVDGPPEVLAELMAQYGPDSVTAVDEKTSSCFAPAYIEAELDLAQKQLKRPLNLVSLMRAL